jgi:hypothetical protein
MRESESKWNARATARKASDRNQITHAQSSSPPSSAAAVVRITCSLARYQAINLHITATPRTSESLDFQTIHGTSSHILHSSKLDVDTNCLEPKVFKPNGLVRSGDRYRDGDIESAREWVVLLLSCAAAYAYPCPLML